MKALQSALRLNELFGGARYLPLPPTEAIQPTISIRPFNTPADLQRHSMLSRWDATSMDETLKVADVARNQTRAQGKKMKHWKVRRERLGG
jgi:hypothetical protein